MNFLSSGDILNKNQIANVSLQNLAFIGDAVHTLYVRTKLLKQNINVKSVHAKTTAFVNAGKQSQIVAKLVDLLSEEELNVYKRGRNYKSTTSAKNAKITDYRNATGFEALLGYLFLLGNDDRLNELLKLSFELGQE